MNNANCDRDFPTRKFAVARASHRTKLQFSQFVDEVLHDFIERTSHTRLGLLAPIAHSLQWSAALFAGNPHIAMGRVQ